MSNSSDCSSQPPPSVDIVPSATNPSSTSSSSNNNETSTPGNKESGKQKGGGAAHSTSGSSDTGEESSDDELPPSYSQIDTAGRETTPEEDTLILTRWKWVLIVVLAIVWVLFLIALGAVPLALISMGVIHQDECPENERIPDWMVVMGAGMLFWTLLLRIAAKKRTIIERELRATNPGLPDYSVFVEKLFNERHRKLSQAIGIFQIFLVIWLIIGSIWVFNCKDCREYDYQDNGPETGCDKDTYNFAFWFLISLYIMGALPFIFFSIWICYAMIAQHNNA